VAGEDITISFSDREDTVGTDSAGRFSDSATVPDNVGNTWNVAARFDGDAKNNYAGGLEATSVVPAATKNPPPTTPPSITNVTPTIPPLGSVFNNSLTKKLIPNTIPPLGSVFNNSLTKKLIPNDQIPWSIIVIIVVIIIIIVIVAIVRAFSRRPKLEPPSGISGPSTQNGGAPELFISHAPISQTQISSNLPATSQEINTHSEYSLRLSPHIGNTIGDVKILTTGGIDHLSSINSAILQPEPFLNNIRRDVVVRIEAGIEE
jgi:hypothetical protein